MGLMRNSKSAPRATNNIPRRWFASPGLASVISDEPVIRPGYTPQSYRGDIEAYGGFLVAESIVPEHVQLIASAPEMYHLLVEIREHLADEIRRWYPIDVGSVTSEVADRVIDEHPIIGRIDEIIDRIGGDSS